MRSSSEYRKPIRREDLKSAIRRAMRLGVWFRLKPLKRSILELAARTLKIIKSPILMELFHELLDLINPSRRLLREAFKIGYKILKRRIEQAVMLGNKKAVNWLRNKELILAYGLSYLNTPPFYRTEI